MIYYGNYYETLISNSSPYYEYNNKVDLGDIKRFVGDYHKRRRGQVCVHELRVGKFRFDFTSLNPYTRHIRILEYKVTKEDFDGDTKHLGYMQYCNTLAFVTPLGLIRADDLKDKNVGLMQVFKWAHRTRRQERWYLGAVWVKRPKGRKLEERVYYKVVDMMLARVVQGRKEDFF